MIPTDLLEDELDYAVDFRRTSPTPLRSAAQFDATSRQRLARHARHARKRSSGGSPGGIHRRGRGKAHD